MRCWSARRQNFEDTRNGAKLANFQILRQRRRWSNTEGTTMVEDSKEHIQRGSYCRRCAALATYGLAHLNESIASHFETDCVRGAHSFSFCINATEMMPCSRCRYRTGLCQTKRTFAHLVVWSKFVLCSRGTSSKKKLVPLAWRPIAPVLLCV